MAKKPSMGRQKIKIQKIEVKNHLQVTFSKRRSGLFKKASELCTLCGVEIGIIVFSPAGKVFSFGHPNVESIIDRYLSRNPAPNANDPFHLMEAQRNASVRELNQQLGHILNEVEAERKRGESLDSMRKANQSHYWWESPINKLGLEELEQVKEAMEELKKNVNHQAAKLVNASATSLFMANRAGVFDHYETKPTHGVVTSNINNIAAAAAAANGNFGYCHGFF
ncbi:agamous-like MADS-box protein AGL61 [Salvia miltiorrhiza]|uniref:agamous-like MADS-box protein AGL61 n=1 Tax=Salvia miltiorrhiza TaxID=226208 RepID=UPI0025AD278E|nr:agamous-like MADS-box protein AGL61 [Salvia miltiorrhiza]